MEKEENLNQDDNTKQSTEDNSNTEKLLKEDQTNINKEEMSAEATPEETEATPEEKIKELEDKLARTFAEMENQRRRFEKEKDDAFDYGGFTFAKEALNLIDNLERSKLILESDETLKETGALKKTLEHLEIINKDLISILPKIILNQLIVLTKN